MWTQLPSVGLFGTLNVAATDDGQTVYISGITGTFSTRRTYFIFRIDGNSATPLGGTSIVGAESAFSDMIVAHDGALLVAGPFEGLGPVEGKGIARWDGEWSFLGGPLTVTTQGIAQGSDGTVYALAGNELRRYTGSEWEPLGQADGTTSAIHVAADGSVYVGGIFSSIGGVAAANVARWQNGTWAALGDGIGWPVTQMTTNTDGMPTACGGSSFDQTGGGIASWIGAEWIQEVEIEPDGILTGCEYTPDGDLVFGGFFTEPNGVYAPSIALLDKTGSTPVDPEMGAGSLSLTLAPNPSSGPTAAFVSGLTEPGIVTLFDMLGRRVAQREAVASTGRVPVVLPTAGLSPGVYLVRVASGESVETQRLVVTRR